MAQGPEALNTNLDNILARARNTPMRPALQAEAGLRYLAFGDLAEAHRSFHARMQAAGVRPGTAVSIQVMDPIIHFIAVLSLMSCGATWAVVGQLHGLAITDAVAENGALRIDASWFAPGVQVQEDISATWRMLHNGVEFDASSIKQRVHEAAMALPASAGLTTLCASRVDSISVFAHVLAALSGGGAIVFAAPDPGSFVQMATLAQARIAIAPANLVSVLAAIIRSGEPLDLCFDAVLVEGTLSEENLDELRLTCARRVIPLA